MMGSSRVNFCAEISLILGVLAFSCLIFADYVPEAAVAVNFAVPAVLAALLLGAIGRLLSRRRGESLVVANLGIFFASVMCLLVCSFPGGSGGARTAARRAQLTNNLKQIGLALHNYHSAEGRLPPAVVRDKDGKPLYSWRVLILPYMEESKLYQQFHLDEPWDSPHNRTLLDKAPWALRPIGVDESVRGGTYIQAFVGPGSAFENPEGEPFELPDNQSNFPDGLDKTILAVEAAQPVPWTQPVDLVFHPKDPLPALGGAYPRSRAWFAMKPKIEGFSVLFADGRVKYLKNGNEHEALLRALISRNDGLPRDNVDP